MIKSSYILLDTCIVNALLSEEQFLQNKIDFILKQFLKDGNVLCVSEFSRYELLRSASKAREIDCANMLKKFSVIPHSSERLSRATYLYGLYKNEPSVKNILHSISDVDIFIGSLIFTDQKPYLLTADFADFPRPFFVEKDIFPIEFRRPRGNMNCLYYYLLQANV